MKIFEYVEEILITIGLVVMTTLAFGNVLSRYLFHASWSFTEEITTSLFVWVTFLGASVAAKRKGHLGLSIITDNLPPKGQKVAVLFSVATATVVFGILLKYGLEMVITQYKMNQTSPAIGWPEWIYGTAIPVGAILMIVRFLELGYNELKGGQK